MAIRITTLSRLALLLELSKGPRHGYVLMKAVEQMTGAPCSPAQIYPFLTVLEKQKLVTRKTMRLTRGTKGTSAGSPREQQPYTLTPAGKKFVQNVLSKFGQILQLALAGQVTECAHCSCKIYGQAVWGINHGVKLPYCCPHCAQHAGAKT
jgi:DNA-binding PadR family transcriptional regulator